jgi:antitoxin FitA
MLARYGGAMPSVQIKDVPPEVHRALRLRAAARGQSLQEYLLALLVEEVSLPTVDDVLARAGGRSGGHVSFEQATDIIRELRGT